LQRHCYSSDDALLLLLLLLLQLLSTKLTSRHSLLRFWIAANSLYQQGVDASG
jgi:hypothetical protein